MTTTPPSGPKSTAEWRRAQADAGLCRECTNPALLVRLKNGKTRRYKSCPEHLAKDAARKKGARP